MDQSVIRGEYDLKDMLLAPTLVSEDVRSARDCTTASVQPERRGRLDRPWVYLDILPAQPPG